MLPKCALSTDTSSGSSCRLSDLLFQSDGTVYRDRGVHQLGGVRPLRQKAGGVLPFIARYYSYQTLLFFDRTGGILAMVSAMFTVSWIQRHNEMTALMAAGVSHPRAYADHPLCGRDQFAFGGEPRDPHPAISQRVVATAPRPVRRHAQRSNSASTARRTCIWAENTRLPTKSGSKSPFSAAAGPAPIRQAITADNAYYQPPQGNRPGGYLMDGVQEPKNLDTRPSLG